jgi:hypothetical protein
MFGRPIEHPPPLDPETWEKNTAYLHGIDLFNHGFYWEAHEAWEGLWHACGRQGQVADFLKGLIKLAAAGVKMREGKPHGVVNHAARAADLFWRIDQYYGGKGACFLGLSLRELIDFTDLIGRKALSARADDDPNVRVVFGFVLKPTPSPPTPLLRREGEGSNGSPLSPASRERGTNGSPLSPAAGEKGRR